MRAVPAGILFTFVGLVSAIPVSKEGKTSQNNLDFQVDPQLLNYHLQQLLLEQDQQSKQAQRTPVQPQTTQYSAQDHQYQAQLQQQLQQFQAQYQDQLQQQLQSQLQAQLQQQLQSQHYQTQLDSKTSQTALQIPQSNSLGINPYQQPTPVDYAQPSSVQYQQPSAVQYQQPSSLAYQESAFQQQQPSANQATQQFQQQSVQYTQPNAQQYQAQPSQDARQALLGVAYSSAVDASKTSFSGYGIKYSF